MIRNIVGRKTKVPSFPVHINPPRAGGRPDRAKPLFHAQREAGYSESRWFSTVDPWPGRVQSRKPVRFLIDGHTFAITGGREECDLVEECGGELVPLARLAVSESAFEDHLLAAVGAALQA